MKTKPLIIYLLTISAFVLNSCLSKQTVVVPVYPQEPVHPKIVITNNFVFTALNNYINTPGKDQRVFYKIFIDKEELGRTTTGLESQKKIFETNLSENKHLLRVEKWVLNDNEEYVKANNVLQPKPDFVYFDIVADKATFVVLDVNNKGQYEFFVKLSH